MWINYAPSRYTRTVGLSKKQLFYTLKNDQRFFIDDFNLSRIIYKPIVKYHISKVSIGNIRMRIDGIPYRLQDTPAYKYLEFGLSAKEQYDDYCKKYGIRNVNRTVENYNELIKSFSSERYDLNSGAIVVNSSMYVQEGQHRCCILLKELGKKAKIDVVIVYYECWIIDMIKDRIKEVINVLFKGAL